MPCHAVLFMLISLFLSDSGLKLGKFQSLTLSLFYHNIAWVNSRGGKTVCRIENITGQGENNPVSSIYWQNMDTETDTSCNNTCTKTLEDYRRHVQEQYHGLHNENNT